METYIWIAISWIFLNIIVKLFVNSIERIFKDKIDNTILKIPSASKIILAQVIRLLLVVFFAPILVISFFIPSKYQNKIMISDFIFLNKLLLSKGFASKLPFIVFVVTHPKLWIYPDAYQNEIKLLLENKSEQRARITRRSS